jgi:hypothetical protein
MERVMGEDAEVREATASGKMKGSMEEIGCCRGC